jgi:uncharacterized small protein (DUF1192 family)
MEQFSELQSRIDGLQRSIDRSEAEKEGVELELDTLGQELAVALAAERRRKLEVLQLHSACVQDEVRALVCSAMPHHSPFALVCAAYNNLNDFVALPLLSGPYVQLGAVEDEERAVVLQREVAQLTAELAFKTAAGTGDGAGDGDQHEVSRFWRLVLYSIIYPRFADMPQRHLGCQLTSTRR